MEPRIDYENPLAPRRPDRIAGADKARREDRKQTPGKRRKPGKRDRDSSDSDGPEEDIKRPSEEHLGERVDLEA
jgi:hypothetical protein